MPKKSGQLEAVSYIRSVLVERGYSVPSKSVRVIGEDWLVFELEQRSIGIDPSSGVWVKETAEGEWRCIEESRTIGGMLVAVEFFTKE